MGAKQSKRSVDISGKEAEGGGEVAAAGAGGEGRVEQIADLDALKPQINGDAHIQNEQTDKEKELDGGTPENEKDATTEKEEKKGSEKEKEEAPVTNGDAEDKPENGESTPPAEDGKKPKKEKVKKKWSLRSISFSRKDKPKQEKKQKEEEPKTNGEPEKVPEEAAENNPEPAVNEVAEEAKAVTAVKEEASPSTPVTEPLTNGSSTPEEAAPVTSAPEPAPASAPAPAPASPAPLPEADKPEVKPDTEPEQLPVNGLSLQDSKPEPAEPEKTDEIKPEAPVVETVETAPAPEIPVKEVCVEQMPLLEPTPPPLPANPPPSSVVSFAATTMAPELTDASLPNTADTALALPHIDSNTKTTDTHVFANDVSSALKTNEVESQPQVIEQELLSPAPVDAPKETDGDDVSASQTVITTENGLDENSDNVAATVEQIDESTSRPVDITPEFIESKPEVVDVTSEFIESKPQVVDVTPELIESKPEPVEIAPRSVESESEKVVDIPQVVETILEQAVPVDVLGSKIESVEADSAAEKSEDNTVEEINENEPELIDIPPPELESPSTIESPLPPPPPMQDDEEIADSLALDDIKPIPEDIPPESETNHVVNNVVNGVNGISPVESTNEDDKIVVTVAACNGDVSQEEADAASVGAAPDTTQHTQEAVTVSDKLAELIPEVPDVPELKTETLQQTVSASDVAVAN